MSIPEMRGPSWTGQRKGPPRGGPPAKTYTHDRSRKSMGGIRPAKSANWPPEFYARELSQKDDRPTSRCSAIRSPHGIPIINAPKSKFMKRCSGRRNTRDRNRDPRSVGEGPIPRRDEAFNEAIGSVGQRVSSFRMTKISHKTI